MKNNKKNNKNQHNRFTWEEGDIEFISEEELKKQVSDGKFTLY